jgi:Helix-turn-helix domain
MTTPPVLVYSPEEAATILHCRPSWLKEQARLRRIPFTMIGGAYRFTAEHLAEIVRLGEQAAAVPVRQASRRISAPAGPDAPILQGRPPRRARGPDMPAGHAPTAA